MNLVRKQGRPFACRTHQSTCVLHARTRVGGVPKFIRITSIHIGTIANDRDPLVPMFSYSMQDQLKGSEGLTLAVCRVKTEELERELERKA